MLGKSSRARAWDGEGGWSRDGEKVLFRDLVAHHHLPAIKDAAPHTRMSTASHLGNGSGALVRQGHSAQRVARSKLFALGKLSIATIGPDEVLQVAVDQGWLTLHAVDRARLSGAAAGQQRRLTCRPTAAG